MPSASEFVACQNALANADELATKSAEVADALKLLLKVANGEWVKHLQDRKNAEAKLLGLEYETIVEREALLAGPEGNPETALQRCQDLPQELLIKIYYAYIHYTEFKEMRDYAGCKFTLKVAPYDRQTLFHTRFYRDLREQADKCVHHYQDRPEVCLHIKSRAGDIAFRTKVKKGENARVATALWHNWYAVSNKDACPAMLGNGISKTIHHALEDVEEPKPAQLKKFNNINKSGVAQLWRTTPKPRHICYEAVDIMGQVIPGSKINILKKLWPAGERPRQNSAWACFRYN